MTNEQRLSKRHLNGVTRSKDSVKSLDDNQCSRWLVPLQNRESARQVLEVRFHYYHVVKMTAKKVGIFGGCHNLITEAHNNREFLTRIIMEDSPVLAVQSSSCPSCELHWEVSPYSLRCPTSRKLYYDQEGWCSSNATDAWFKSWVEYQLFWGFMWFSSVPPEKYQKRTSIRLWPLPSKSFPIHYSSVILPLDAIQSTILTAS
jgi:hypothetical protein